MRSYSISDRGHLQPSKLWPKQECNTHGDCMVKVGMSSAPHISWTLPQDSSKAGPETLEGMADCRSDKAYLIRVFSCSLPSFLHKTINCNNGKAITRLRKRSWNRVLTEHLQQMVHVICLTDPN